MRILNIDPQWPGSCHDAFVWGQSALRQHFELGQLISEGEFLLGELYRHFRHIIYLKYEERCTQKRREKNELSSLMHSCVSALQTPVDTYQVILAIA